MHLYVAIVICIIIIFLIINYYSNKIRNIKISTKLWTDHLLYTKLVYNAFLRNSPELENLKSRLVFNQTDIGNYVTIQFGKSHGDKVTELLTAHILIAVDVLTAIKNNNNLEKVNNLKRFYNNANEIGEYLNKLYGTNTFAHHMKMHIDHLVESISNFTINKFNDEIKTLDSYVHAGVDMAFDMA